MPRQSVGKKSSSGLGNHPEMRRIAIVGKSRLEKISISLTNAIIKPELNYFEAEQEAREGLLKTN